MPSTYFQCSKPTWPGSNPIGTKLPLRKEAEITMRYGARTNTSRATSNRREMPSRIVLFCWESLGERVRFHRGNRIVPTADEPVSLAFLQRWVKHVVWCRKPCNFIGRGPKPATESSGERRTQTRQLGCLAPQDL